MLRSEKKVKKDLSSGVTVRHRPAVPKGPSGDACEEQNTTRVTRSFPLPPSVNQGYTNTPHFYRDRNGILKQRSSRRPSDEAEAWMKAVNLVARTSCRREGFGFADPGEKVVVELVVYWPDKRARDMNNLHKFVADALEGAVFPNDSAALLRDMDYHVDREDPRLELTWYRKERET